MTKRLLIAMVAVVLGLVIGWRTRGFMIVDKCLDSGGRWDYEWKQCDRVAPQAGESHDSVIH
jgi:hypothetical protein